MRAIFFLVLTLTLTGTTSGFFFDTIIGAAEDILDTGLTALNHVLDTGVNIGGKIIGAVVDPFGVMGTTADDHGHATGQVAKCPAIADIIFVIDTSSSMSSKQFELEKQFAVRLSEHFKIGPNDVRIGGIVFSDRVVKVLALSDSKDFSTVQVVLGLAQFLGGGTRTYDALDYIRLNNLFSTSNGGRVRSSKIVVLISDGNSDSLSKTKSAAEALRNQGIIIISVGIGSGFGLELYNVASGSKNVFTADGFDSLIRIEQTVARRTCEIPAGDGFIPSGSGTGGAACQAGFKQNPSDTNTCIDLNECQEKNPCEQNCVNLVGNFRCSCQPGFAISDTDPNKCLVVQTCSSLADIIIVFDASGSIGTDNYQTQLNFISKFVKHFSIGASSVKFGGLVFSTDVQKLFDLNTYGSSNAIAQAILSTPYLNGATFTNKALNYIKDNGMFSAAAGGRATAPDIVIVITDGKSSREDLTTTSVNALKKQGVKIMSVGISNQVSTDELVSMASTSNDVFVVGDFDLLDYIEKRLTERVCINTSG